MEAPDADPPLSRLSGTAAPLRLPRGSPRDRRRTSRSRQVTRTARRRLLEARRGRPARLRRVPHGLSGRSRTAGARPLPDRGPYAVPGGIPRRTLDPQGVLSLSGSRARTGGAVRDGVVFEGMGRLSLRRRPLENELPGPGSDVHARDRRGAFRRHHLSGGRLRARGHDLTGASAFSG